MRSKLENTFLSKEKIRLASSDCLRWKRDIRKLTCVLIFLGRGNTRRRKTGIAVQMSKTLLYLRDHKIESIEQLDLLVQQQTARRDTLLFSIQQSEKRLAEIGILKKHIINYSKTRATYEEYWKAGYSKKFLEAHREEISIHKAAKAAFDELGVKKLFRVKELSVEYAEVLAAKNGPT